MNTIFPRVDFKTAFPRKYLLQVKKSIKVLTNSDADVIIKSRLEISNYSNL